MSKPQPLQEVKQREQRHHPAADHPFLRAFSPRRMARENFNRRVPPHTPSQLRKLAHGHRWGHWRLDAVRLCLLLEVPHREGGTFLPYEIDLERHFVFSSAALDILFQLAGKGWDEEWPGVTGDLVLAIRDIINPQAVLCSGGMSRKLKNVQAYLRKRMEPPTQSEKLCVDRWLAGDRATPWIESDLRGSPA